jgi:hypothetical protein
MHWHTVTWRCRKLLLICVSLSSFTAVKSPQMKINVPWIIDQHFYYTYIDVLCDQSVIFSFTFLVHFTRFFRVESSWNVMAHGNAQGGGMWRRNWRMEWVASTLHTTSEHSVSSITTADAHSLPASSRLNWCRRRFKWIRPFHQKMKSGFCMFAITFQLASTSVCIRAAQYVGRMWSLQEVCVALSNQNIFNNTI